MGGQPLHSWRNCPQRTSTLLVHVGRSSANCGPASPLQSTGAEEMLYRRQCAMAPTASVCSRCDCQSLARRTTHFTLLLLHHCTDTLLVQRMLGYAQYVARPASWPPRPYTSSFSYLVQQNSASIYFHESAQLAGFRHSLLVTARGASGAANLHTLLDDFDSEVQLNTYADHQPIIDRFLESLRQACSTSLPGHLAQLAAAAQG